MGSDSARAVSTGEMMNRANLAKSLVATRRLAVGDRITRDAVAVKSPGRGVQPNRLEELVGRVTRRVVEEGDFFYDTDLTDAVARGRHYSFRRPWGLPVRYHDAVKLTSDNDTNPDFLEFHLSYKDVEMDLSTAFRAASTAWGYTVHCPDLYAGDFIINLASEDEDTWQRSIVEAQKVIQITRDLGRWFDADEPPVVICTMGGFTKDAFVDPERRPRMYARIAQALERLDESDVRLTAQTLPPFPRLMGGQQHHNLFMGLDDTVEFCRQYGTPPDPGPVAPRSWQRPSTASRSAPTSSSWRRCRTTCTSWTPRVSTARARRSARARSTGRRPPPNWIGSRPASPSSRRSGRATSTTARASGPRSTASRRGSDMSAVSLASAGASPAIKADRFRELDGLRGIAASRVAQPLHLPVRRHLPWPHAFPLRPVAGLAWRPRSSS